MIEWLWRRLEMKVEVAITRRIVTFYQAMIERGQLPEKAGKLPPVT